MLLKRSIAATIQIQNPRGKRSAYHNRNRKSKGGRFMSPSSLLLYYHHQQEVAGPIIMSRSHFQSSFRCPLRMFLHALLLITTLHKSVYAQLEIHLPIKYKVDQQYCTFLLLNLFNKHEATPYLTNAPHHRNLSHNIISIDATTKTHKRQYIKKQQECIYDHFQPKDRITFSVFLHDALRSRPKISVAYEGPVSGDERSSQHSDEWVDPRNPTTHSLGRQLQQSVTKTWPAIKDVDKLQRDPDQRLGVLNTRFTVDWTHAGEEEDAASAREAIEERNRKQKKNWAVQLHHHRELEKEGKVDMRAAPPLPVSTVPMSTISPFEQTIPLNAEGWYRLCVNGVDSTPVLVEMTMRSMNNFKGVDPDTGHVYTYTKRRMLDEAALLDNESEEAEGADDHNTYGTSEEEKAKIIENQIRENDLKESKNFMRDMMELTSQMSQKQQAHMARIRSHAGSARRNHENLVWSSKVETLLYAIITGFQVYTLRKWLLGNSMLGR